MENRVIYLDVLRIIAVFGVMLLHVSAVNWHHSEVIAWHNVPLDSWVWKVSNIYNAVARFCVPVFFMISGALFLGPKRDVPFRILVRKNLFRIITAFIFWSAAYSVAVSLFIFKSTHQFSVLDMLQRFLYGHYHLWFLFAIMGLYLIVPFLRKIVIERNLLRYFLLLSLIFAVIIPTLQLFPQLIKTKEITNDIGLYFVTGYVFYFVLGYYLSITDFSKNKIIYLLTGLAGVIVTAIVSYVVSVRQGYVYYDISGYLTLNCACYAVAVFLLCKNRFKILKFSEKSQQIILLLSKLAFGMYLCHDFFVKLLAGFITHINPLLSIPFVTVIVFIGSFFVTLLISKIPFFNKYII